MPQCALISPSDPVANERKRRLDAIIGGENEDENTVPGTLDKFMNAKL